jgi:hypothetical protein
MYNICHDYYLYLSKKFVDMLIGVSSCPPSFPHSSVSGVFEIALIIALAAPAFAQALAQIAEIAACQSFGF